MPGRDRIEMTLQEAAENYAMARAAYESANLAEARAIADQDRACFVKREAMASAHHAEAELLKIASAALSNLSTAPPSGGPTNNE